MATANKKAKVIKPEPFVYVIGSLRNMSIPFLALQLRERGFNVFDDWFAAGPEADDKWKEYELSRERTYKEALMGEAAENIFNFDKRHLDACAAAVLVAPAGRSAHLELGYIIGSGKPGFIYSEEGYLNDRWDVMYKFATDVTSNLDHLIELLKKEGL